MGLKTSALGEHQRHVLAPIEPLTSTSAVIGMSAHSVAHAARAGCGLQLCP